MGCFPIVDTVRQRIRLHLNTCKQFISRLNVYASVSVGVSRYHSVCFVPHFTFYFNQLRIKNCKIIFEIDIVIVSKSNALIDFCSLFFLTLLSLSLSRSCVDFHLKRIKYFLSNRMKMKKNMCIP